MHLVRLYRIEAVTWDRGCDHRDVLGLGRVDSSHRQREWGGREAASETGTDETVARDV